MCIRDRGWYVFVDEPQSEAYRSLMAQVWRGAVFALCGIVFTMLTSLSLIHIF